MREIILSTNADSWSEAYSNTFTAEALNITSNALNITEEVSNIREQQTEFKESVDSIEAQLNTTESANKTDSQSPSYSDADLIKPEE